MIVSWRWIASTAAVGCTVLLTAGSASAALDKCQAAIEKNGQKFESAVLKVITKCADGYTKNLVKNLPTSGTSCEGSLAKVIDFLNPVSAVNKTKNALDALLTKGTCNDTELVGLGQLPTSVFGDRWARLVLIASIKGAFDTQNALVGNFTGIMTALAGAGCPLCNRFAVPPCQTHACTLAPASGASTIVSGSPVPVSLTGVNLFSLCEFPSILTNEIGVISTPARPFKPATLGPLTVCSNTIRNNSIINCAGGASPTVSVSTCQDSNLSDGNECPAPGPTTFCQPNPDANTGGACLTMTPGAPAAGQSFALVTNVIRISSAAGADGVSCTADDTYATPYSPAQLPVTSASASATVLDYGNVLGNDVSGGPITGVAAPSCAQLRSSNISSGELVTAFPNADTVGSPLGDTVTTLRLVCS